MRESSAAMAPRESCQRDFSHGLQDFHTWGKDSWTHYVGGPAHGVFAMSKNRVKTFVESISILGVTARMAPIGLQIYAADFLAAAKAVPSPDGPFAPARTYLACHAVELALIPSLGD
jgi:hypothetical protein